MPDDTLTTVTDATFAEIVLSAKVPVLVDFWAQWCPPCGPLKRVLSELAGEFGDRVLIATLDVDANPSTTIAYRVHSMPTLLFLRDGTVTQTIVGARPKSVLRPAITNLITPYANV
ncbi:thioredoxin family protein [Actinoplanes hulinensis]|uniref:Thioredoxin n=2 Tax=Actinoplanes TaxID=1865 RepID=A0A7W5ABQ6_9ACTN|nr:MULTISPECIES: thioredoxin domain-containing protein [Actinoplanes]MBB3093346.1 thioredoxin 1 [Actinoplanes campanulatus]MBW6438875.1 thioredoxin family protein [Actinoplanes hulinensis]GGN02934.1 thioredoxin [Actinoplanes campanulatus]GID33559.1 thioredoxin [Actinoplanes campanulatus]